MSITQTITEMPDAPQRSDPDDFAARGDAFMEGMEDLPPEINTFGTQANALASDVNDDAASASTSASTAAAAANQTIYASGTTYAAGAIVQDPADGYRSYTSQQGSNTGHIPNSDDGTWWERYFAMELSEDSSPQLGGDLDGQGHSQYNTIMKISALGSVSANQTLDCSAYTQFTLEPTADITLNFTNIVAGAMISVRITGGGDHTLTWQVGGATTGWKWDKGAEPDWSTTTGIDLAILVGTGTNAVDAGLSLGDIS